MPRNKQHNKTRNSWPVYIAGVILIIWLGYGLRVFHLGEQSFWWDEVATFIRADYSIGRLLDNLFTVRNHMPLYFFFMKAWIGIGHNEFILRYFSLITGVLAIALIARTGRLIGGQWTGILAAFILALSPFNIWFSQEARMYALLAFSVLAANWFLLRVLHGGDRRDWIGYTIALIIATYSHYMAVLVVIAHYAFFSLHYRYLKPLFRKWLIYAGFAGIIFGIWIIAIMVTGGFTNSPIGWIKPARWFDPILTLLSLSIGPTIDPGQFWPYIVLIVYSVAISVGFVTYIHMPSNPEENKKAWLNTLTFRLLILWLVVPILLVFFISIDLPIPQKRSIYMDRYLIVTLPALILLGAWGFVTTYQKRNWKWILPTGLILISATSYLVLRNLFFDPIYARVNWRDAISQITTDWQEGDIYLMNLSQPIMAKYYGSEHLATAEIPFSAYSDGTTLAEKELNALLKETKIDHDRAWLITEYPNIDPHGFPLDRNNELYPDDASRFVEDWLDKNCPSIGQWFYTGIRLNLYDIGRCQLPTIAQQQD